MTVSDSQTRPQLGAISRLSVVKQVDFGVYLDGKSLGEILLPKRYLPETGGEPGDKIDVFLYKDSDDRLIATTETPRVMVDQCACLKVIEVNHIGAFLDWGLSRDLLVPHSEQTGRMTPGKSYVVNVYIDELTERITATAKLDGWLSEEGVYFKPRQAVDLLIYGHTELGYKAVINHTHLGLIYKNEVFQPITYGQRLQGYIKRIRDDKKIDLCLQQPAAETQDKLMQSIIRYLQENQGVSTLTDKSPPADIYAQFHVSKKNYKRALGRLYKQREIRIEAGRIVLIR